MNITSHRLGGDARWTRKTRLDALEPTFSCLRQQHSSLLRIASHAKLQPEASRISSGSCTALAAYSSHAV